MGIFLKWSHLRSRSSGGQIALDRPMLYGYQIWLEEPLTRAQCIAGVNKHVGVSQGQSVINLHRNALWPLNLVGNPLIRVQCIAWIEVHVDVYQRIICLVISYGYQIKVGKTPDQSTVHCWVKGHTGVNQRSTCVEMCPMATKYGWKNSDQSSAHCLGQRSCRSQLWSTRCQFALQYFMDTKFGQNSWPDHNMLLGSKVMQGLPEINLLRNAQC